VRRNGERGEGRGGKKNTMQVCEALKAQVDFYSIPYDALGSDEPVLFFGVYYEPLYDHQLSRRVKKNISRMDRHEHTNVPDDFPR
jgi:hypothetical protein